MKILGGMASPHEEERLFHLEKRGVRGDKKEISTVMHGREGKSAAPVYSLTIQEDTKNYKKHVFKTVERKYFEEVRAHVTHCYKVLFGLVGFQKGLNTSLNENILRG